MTAIRWVFFAVAAGFVLLALQQGWQARGLLSDDPADGAAARSWIALGAALACLVAAVATVLSALKIRPDGRSEKGP